MLQEHQTLTKEQTDAAVQELVSKFPVGVKSDFDEPISQQGLGLISQFFFAEPKKLPNGKYVYGFQKLRGNYPGDERDMTYALKGASNIVKNQDSKHPIRIVPVGHWFPITNDDSAVKEKIDVRMNDEERHLRDEAVREKQQEDKNIIRQLRQREEELKRDDDDVYARPESLDFYTMKRVTEFRLYDAVLGQLKKYEDLRDKLNETRTILVGLEQNHPEYENQWVERYNEKLAETKCGSFVPNQLNVDDYIAWKKERIVTRNE